MKWALIVLLALAGCRSKDEAKLALAAPIETITFPGVSESGVYTDLRGTEIYGYVGFQSTEGFGTDWTIRIDLNEHESVSVAGAEFQINPEIRHVGSRRISFEFDYPYQGGSHLLLWVVPLDGSPPRKYYETLCPLSHADTH